MKAFLVYPHQLFENSKLFSILNAATDKVYLVEEPLLFTQFKFHKQKNLFHRITMKKYAAYVSRKGFKVEYIDTSRLTTSTDIAGMVDALEVYMYDPTDTWLEQRLTKAFKNRLRYLQTPMFINSREQNQAFFGKHKKPFMKTFYAWQRKRLNILMDEDGKPLGGSFSYDIENRKKLSKDYIEPKNVSFLKDEYTIEALQYVEKNFEANYGSLESFPYASDFASAKKVLEHFLATKLVNFGVYEDAISKDLAYINHSILTPYLNAGLLTPEYVVKQTLDYVAKNQGSIPLNSLEGFLRQIIGWREFIRAMYELHGTAMRTRNFWKHTKKLGPEFWTATTGNVVVDTTIQKVLQNAYAHHIERLMIMGNYMLLSEYDVNDVYTWFMELFIDSYDWVMVPNVYGMSQFADGGIFATKPYVSASNYIYKMSDYKKDGVWDKEWDEKFWSFLKKHRSFFEKNPRFKMLLSRV